MSDTPKKNQDPRLNVRVDDQTLWELKERALKERKTVTDLVNEWIREKLAQQEQQRVALA